MSYLGLALVHSISATLAVIAFYGLYHGLSEGAERALLASLAPPETRGRAFGIYYALSGIAALVAGVGFGAGWGWLGQSTAFLSAAAIAGASAALLVALLPVARGRAPGRPSRRAPRLRFATLGARLARAAVLGRGGACP